MDFLKTLSDRNTKASGGGGNYFRQGQGTAIVNLLKYDPKGNEGPVSIGEFMIETVTPYPDAVDADGKPEKPNYPGEVVSWAQKLQKHKSAPGNVKAFYLALLGAEEPAENETDAVKAAFAKQFEAAVANAISTHQPCKGMRINFRTRQATIQNGKNAGTIITVPMFSFVPDQKPDEIASRRAMLDQVQAAQAPAPTQATPAATTAPAA